MIDSQPTSKNRNLLNRKTMSGPIDSNDSFSWFRKTVTMALMYEGSTFRGERGEHNGRRTPAAVQMTHAVPQSNLG
jgi:hypothetical protein